MVNITKRKADNADIPQIIEVARRIWLPAFSPYFSKKELNSLFQGMYNPEKLLKDLQNLHYEFYFVENSLQMCMGYFATLVQSDSIKLDKLYVHPNLKGQGLGKWIYQTILQQARSQNLHKIELNVNRRNEPAIGFYKSLGFTILKEEDLP